MHGHRDELMAVLGVQETRGTEVAEEPTEHLEGATQAKPLGHVECLAFPCPRVDHGQALELLSVCRARVKKNATTKRAQVSAANLDAHGPPIDAPFIRPCRGTALRGWWT